MEKFRGLFRRPLQIAACATVIVLVGSGFAGATSAASTTTSSSSVTSCPAVDPDVGLGDDKLANGLDADGDNDEAVQGLAISTATLPNAMLLRDYSQALTATGAVYGSPVTWSLTSPASSLPTGLSLSSDGVISGQPASGDATGTYTFTVAATGTVQPVDEDDAGAECAEENPGVENHEPATLPQTSATATATLSLTLVPTIELSTTTLPPAHIGVPYAYLLTATGGSTSDQNAQFEWTLLNGSFVVSTTKSSTTTPGLPPGLTLSSNGVISGTPTSAGLDTFDLQVDNAALPGYKATAKGLELAVEPTTLQILTDVLPDGQAGSNYSQTFTATGGTAPYTWSVVSGALPAGLSLDPNTGTLSGTPTELAGSVASFTVEATDAGSTATGALPQQQKADVLVDVVIDPATQISISPTTLPSGQVGQAYTQLLQAAGGTPPYTFGLAGTSKPLPTGMTLSSGGLLSGTPTSTFSGDITIEVTDSATPAQIKDVSVPLTIAPPGLTINVVTLPDATVGDSYSATITASGGTTPYTWSWAAESSASSTPAGLNISTEADNATGLISGTPTAAGTYYVTVTAKDSNGATAQTSLSLTVKSSTALSITTSPTLPDAEEGVAYSAILNATGGDSPNYNWVLGNHSIMPLGLTLQPYSGNSGSSNAGDGVITGTPAPGSSTGGDGKGNYQFTINVTDDVGGSATQTFNLKVLPPVTIQTTSIPNGEVGAKYSATIDTSGGSGSNKWSVSKGSLPGGLSLNPSSDGSSATISGTPTSTATGATFTVQVVDKNGSTATEQYTMNINPAVQAQAVSPTTAGSGGGYSATLSATGGDGNYTWSSSDLPTWLSISGNTLSGTAPKESSTTKFGFHVTVTDGLGGSSTESVTITVS